MKIYKYSLELVPEQQVEMPLGASILTVQIQNDIPYLWALVDPKIHTVRRTIYIRGTGHEFDVKAFKYINTFQLLNGELIWHVFEGA
jgi:hypothetical protein